MMEAGGGEELAGSFMCDRALLDGWDRDPPPMAARQEPRPADGRIGKTTSGFYIINRGMAISPNRHFLAPKRKKEQKKSLPGAAHRGLPNSSTPNPEVF
jgi:hypothetical protein